MALKLLSLRSLRHFTKYRECSSFPTQLQYEKAANETLDKISDYLDVLPDALPVDSAYDVTNAMGVVTAVISKEIGTYVINKQSPNKQIWLSSPLSGPKRYDLTQDHRWIYTHDQEPLDVLLTREFQKIFKTDSLDFSKHV
ncbi:unnamed protein product [Auanema sp. JU1783]|nr:unnamed protein product [Auanema sp. JU1783]